MFREKFNRLKLLRTKLGAAGAFWYLWSLYITGSDPKASSGRTRGRTDIFKIYEFLEFKPFGDSVSANVRNQRTVNWLVPDFFVGAGGHLNIFRLIMQLEKRGYICRVVIIGHTHFKSGMAARQSIRENFFPIDADVSVGEESLRAANITVATSWLTAYPLRNFRGTQYRCYFVQDYEPYFHAHGSEYFFAEATYRWGFLGITAGGWLASKLTCDYGMRTTSMGFSYDRDLYRPAERRDPLIKRVFFYARSITPRRGFELGLLALNKVAQQMPDVVFVLAGWDASTHHIPFQHVNAGNVAVKNLPDLYSQCDAALVLSFTNLSLLPLELMACGCPVVSNRGENVEWLLDHSNSVLADPTPAALADAIIALLNDNSRRQKLVADALKFAASTSWDEEAGRVADFFDELAGGASTGNVA